jgi:hypothetical protein
VRRLSGNARPDQRLQGSAAFGLPLVGIARFANDFDQHNISDVALVEEIWASLRELS